jgi:hypothetical protein
MLINITHTHSSVVKQAWEALIKEKVSFLQTFSEPLTLPVYITEEVHGKQIFCLNSGSHTILHGKCSV